MRHKSIDGRRKYSGNFTTSKDEAYKFDCVEEFDKRLQLFVDKANDTPGSGYFYCIVVEKVD